MEGEGKRKGRQGEKGKREGKWEVKEKRIGREGEGKREECRDKGWGRRGGKIGVRNNFLLTLFRILQGRTENFKGNPLSQGVSRLFFQPEV